MNESDVSKLLGFLHGIYGPRMFVGEATIAAWLCLLGGYSVAEVEQATHEYLASDDARHPPNPGQLAAIAARLVSELPDWDEAWREACHAAGSGKRLEDFEWSSDIVRETVTRFGWRELRQMSDSERGTARAQFREMFNAASRRAVRSQGRERQLKAPKPTLLLDGEK